MGLAPCQAPPLRRGPRLKLLSLPFFASAACICGLVNSDASRKPPATATPKATTPRLASSHLRMIGLPCFGRCPSDRALLLWYDLPLVSARIGSGRLALLAQAQTRAGCSVRPPNSGERGHVVECLAADRRIIKQACHGAT